eukprot:210992_1
MPKKRKTSTKENSSRTIRPTSSRRKKRAKIKHENPTTSTGADGFAKDYWDTNYDDPESMDGVYNAREHAKYARALFELEEINVRSVVDLGFGTGELTRAFVREFKPTRFVGVDPSEHIFEKSTRKIRKTCERVNTKSAFKNTDIRSWCHTDLPKYFSSGIDLGICVSVFQYLSNAEIKKTLPILAKRIRYLYFCAPTKKENRSMRHDFDFSDSYAISRTRDEWYQLLRPHWAVVSSRILESRHFFNDRNTKFSNLLFRN